MELLLNNISWYQYLIVNPYALSTRVAWTDQEGGGGAGGAEDPSPPEKLKTLGYLNNTGLDPLKNHKATKPVFNVGPSSACQQNTI